MSKMKFGPLLMLAASAVAGTVGATTLTFTETSAASGYLDGQQFTDALVTFSGSGNTNDVIFAGSGVYTLALPVTVSVAGIGSDTFSDGIQLVSNQARPAVGLGDTNSNQAILFDGTPLAGYDLTASIGPSTGEAILNPGSMFNTMGGSLTLMHAAAVTYESSVMVGMPEPATWATLLLGMGALGGAMRGRRRGTVAATV